MGWKIPIDTCPRHERYLGAMRAGRGYVVGALGAMVSLLALASPLNAAVPHAPAPRLLAKAGGDPFLVDSRYVLFARRGDRDGHVHVVDTATGRLRGVVIPPGCQALGLDRGVAVLTCATTDITQRIKLLDVRSGRLSAVAPVAANNDQRDELLATRFTDAGRHWIQGEFKSSGDSHTVVTFVLVNRLTGETTKREDNDGPRGWDLNSVALEPRPAEACGIKRWTDFQKPYVLYEQNAARGSYVLSVHRCGGRSTRIARLPEVFSDQALHGGLVTWTEGIDRQKQLAYRIRTHELFVWRIRNADFYATEHAAVFFQRERILIADLPARG